MRSERQAIHEESIYAELLASVTAGGLTTASVVTGVSKSRNYAAQRDPRTGAVTSVRCVVRLAAVKLG